MHVVDHSGQTFGRLTVIGRADFNINEQATWECRCECGKVRYIPGSWLRIGKTRSCGCLRSEITSARKRTHGASNTLLYGVWLSMKRRCDCPTLKGFKDYGGRGIRVCERWKVSFEAFAADVGPRPSERHTLDRVNNDGDYEPSNVRWATWEEQAVNRRPRHTKPSSGFER